MDGLYLSVIMKWKLDFQYYSLKQIIDVWNELHICKVISMKNEWVYGFDSFPIEETRHWSLTI